MDWLCWVIGGLLIVGLLVTVAGHGMWVLLAAICGSGSKSPAPRYQPGDDLARTEAQLHRLLQTGLIDHATYDRVIGAISTLRVRQIARPVLPVDAPQARQEPAAFAIPSEPQPDIAPPAPAVILPAAPVADLPFPKFKPPPQPKPAAPPRPPKKPMSEVLAAFMRESNIRWGELIGGLLIIGGSIALVISFWNQIAGKPFFQFGIFTTVTAALMGLGLYAEHRWKLPTTSRGILLIATLLVPLNFVAFAALSHGAPSAPLVTIVELAA